MVRNSNNNFNFTFIIELTPANKTGLAPIHNWQMHTLSIRTGNWANGGRLNIPLTDNWTVFSSILKNGKRNCHRPPNANSWYTNHRQWNQTTYPVSFFPKSCCRWHDNLTSSYWPQKRVFLRTVLGTNYNLTCCFWFLRRGIVLPRNFPILLETEFLKNSVSLAFTWNRCYREIVATEKL